MSTSVKVPSFGESVSKAVVGQLMVSEGDQVEQDEDLLEFESDKASQVMASPASGVVQSIKVEQGQEVEVGELILTIAERKGEGDENENASSGNEAETSAKARVNYKQQDSSPDKEKQEHDGKSDEAAMPQEASGQNASVSQREVAGKPSSRDTAEHSDHRSQQSDDSETAQQPKINLTSIEQVSAERLQQSWQEIPHVTHFDFADITELERARQELKSSERVSLASFVLKAVAVCLEEFPRFRSRWLDSGDSLQVSTAISINYAVDTEKGLLTPLIDKPEQLSVASIDAAMRDAVAAAKDHRLDKQDLQAGSMTVTNIGSIGGQFFTPIISQPQTAILGLGKAEQQWKLNAEGAMIKCQRLPLSLSYDHRAIDGALAAKLMSQLIALLESSEKLLIHA